MNARRRLPLGRTTFGRATQRRATRLDPLGHPVAAALTALAVVAGAAAWVVAQRRAAHDGHKHRPNIPTHAGGRGFRIERTVTVMRPPLEVYQRWRDLTRLPEFMPHLESVTPLGGNRSRWAARGPGDIELSWEAEMMADEPGRLIAWRSVSGDVDNAGSVRFTEASGKRGTEVKVQMRYAPPAGAVGVALATVLGQGGDRQVREDLRRFKQLLETGEVARAEPLTEGGRQ